MTSMRKRMNSTNDSTSSPSSSESARVFKQVEKKASAVWAGRIFFVVVLSSVGAVLGFTAHHFLTNAETDLAESQFESIADRALNEASGIARRRRWSSVTMASVASEMNPNADDWPFVTMTGFERIVQNLLRSSSGVDMGFVPFVKPEEAAEWENFAYDFYHNSRDPPFPNTTGLSSFGKGIWAIDRTNDAPDFRYHDTDGSTTYDSPNNILTPVFHTDEGANPLLMFNVHYQETRGFAIDDMIECSKQRALMEEPTDEHKCGVITSRLNVVKHNFRPGAAIFQPIYPANNPTTIVGFTPTVLLFDEVLENVFADKVSGVDCVLANENEALTYTVLGGVAQLVGEGDLHQSVYDKFRRAVALTEDEFYTEKSPTYTLSLYPNHDFFEVYHTNNPKIAMIGAVCIILFTSLAFFLYDFFVRREFHAKQELLQAKRQFMRFVSHEVRTPLNSVCMGLAVIQNELAASLGYDSTRLEEIARDDEAAQSLTTTNKESDREKLEWFLLAHEIQANAQGSVDVLNDLLNYDKIEQGTLRLELTPVAIWELIEQAAVEFKLPAARKQLQFDVSFSMNEDDGKEHHLVPFSDLRKLPEEMLKLKLIGDSVRVTQVLRNLISNALKFTPEEGSLRIQASWVKLRAKDAKKALDRKISFKPGEHLTAERRGHVKVTVQDNGAGMSHDQLEKLFSQGLQFNVNELQAGQGSGLGLYIAKGIVDQHEGTLVAASEGLGKGTTFTMTLPLWEFQTTQDGMDVEEGYQKSGSFVTEPIVKLSTLRVLIVDDAVTNRKLLARLLANAGHVCDQAENGSIAVDMVEKSMQVNDPYDAVLLDFEMPVMNGPEAVKEMRRVGSDVHVVGITGNILPEDIAFFISCGANAVLPKPLKIAELDNIWIEYGVVGRTRSP